MITNYDTKVLQALQTIAKELTSIRKLMEKEKKG